MAQQEGQSRMLLVAVVGALVFLPAMRGIVSHNSKPAGIRIRVAA
jgi:hypothetical protein